jgi:multidrug resistance efflux pump
VKEYEISTKQAALPLLKKEADKNIVGRAEEYKATLEAVKALEKARDAEMARLNGLKAVPPTDQVDAARAALVIAEYDLDLANEVLRQFVYRSPVDGTIHRSALYEGMVFGPQMRKEPIVIQPNGKLFIRAEVNQEYANRVALGQKATIVDYSNTSVTWKGKITKVADHFTPKRNNNSSGVELFSSGDDPILEVTIEIEDAKNPVIRQGQRVRVYIGTE